jgi:putative FmdB family regulatory protein
MPVYEYLCDRHGPFTTIRSMSEYLDPQPCPDCERSSSRVMLSVPYLSSLSSDRKAAHARNERSAHAPLAADAYRGSHSPGCSCCSGKMRPRSPAAPTAKGFANKRPWMISH